jgi:hypothetical protein
MNRPFHSLNLEHHVEFNISCRIISPALYSETINADSYEHLTRFTICIGVLPSDLRILGVLVWFPPDFGIEFEFIYIL